MTEELCLQRDWHVSELEKYRIIPYRYCNAQFSSISEMYWKMCVPMIYSHWEAFVVYIFKNLSLFINNKMLDYNEVNECVAILANGPRFSYLSGNQKREQKERFYREFLQAQSEPFCIDEAACIKANSNLNYKQLEKFLYDFGCIDIPEVISSQKSNIERLVTFRNKIAHGENSVIVTEEDVTRFCYCVVELFDALIVFVDSYCQNERYLKLNT